MLECVTSFNLVENMFGHVFDPPTGQWAYTRSANPNRKPFPTKDGYIGLLPYTDQQWDQFFEIAGWGETLSQGSALLRLPHPRRAHRRALQPWSTRSPAPAPPTSGWTLLKPLQIPVVRMNRFDDLPDDPHLQAVGFFERYRASGRRRLRHAPPAGELLQDPRQHPPPSAPTRPAH